MLYIVRVFEYGSIFEYEYGNMDHALEQYNNEKSAAIIEYNKGKETILRNKSLGKELEV